MVRKLLFVTTAASGLFVLTAQKLDAPAVAGDQALAAATAIEIRSVASVTRDRQ